MIEQGGEIMWNVSFNYLAILVAAVVPMLLGAGWYSEALFAHHWMKALGKKKGELTQAGSNYFVTFIGFVIMAYVLSFLIHLQSIHSPLEGSALAVLVWLGFTAAPSMINYLFAGRTRTLYLVDMGYHLLSLAVMGAILAAWW